VITVKKVSGLRAAEDSYSERAQCNFQPA